jgi:hypothetical protein
MPKGPGWFKIPPTRLSGDVILRRQPKNLESVSGWDYEILRFAQNVNVF